MSEQEGKFVPSKYHPRSSNFADVIKQRLGVLDFDYNFDNEFQEFKIVMKFLAETQEAIAQGIIPLEKFGKTELYPSEEVMERLDTIWNGRCYYGISWNENRTRIIQKAFCYNNKQAEINKIPVDRYIPIPRLRNMVPVGKQDDKDNWGIQIRELYPTVFAWEGANYNTIINDGKFAYFTMQGLIPKISPDDMFSDTKKTYILHKPVYHSLMTDLTFFFRKYSTRFQLNMQKINQWMDEGLELEQVITETETDEENNEDD